VSNAVAVTSWAGNSRVAATAAVYRRAAQAGYAEENITGVARLCKG
jgi:hypothetical protein